MHHELILCLAVIESFFGVHYSLRESIISCGENITIAANSNSTGEALWASVKVRNRATSLLDAVLAIRYADPAG